MDKDTHMHSPRMTILLIPTRIGIVPTAYNTSHVCSCFSPHLYVTDVRADNRDMGRSMFHPHVKILFGKRGVGAFVVTQTKATTELAKGLRMLCVHTCRLELSIRMGDGGGNTSECVHLNYPITSGWRRLLVIGSGIDYPHHPPRPHRSTGHWVHWVSVWCCGDDMQWSVMSAVEWHGINTHRVSGHLVSSPFVECP